MKIGAVGLAWQRKQTVQTTLEEKAREILGEVEKIEGNGTR